MSEGGNIESRRRSRSWTRGGARSSILLSSVLVASCAGATAPVSTTATTVPTVALPTTPSSVTPSTVTPSSVTAPPGTTVDDPDAHVSPVIDVPDTPCEATTASGVTEVVVQRTDGRRSYVVHRPDVVGSRLPLLVDLHGTTGTSALQEATSGLGAAGLASKGWITVTPQAIGPVSAWSVPGTVPGDDLNFVEEIVVDMVENACADPDRVYAAGFSSGAAMATWLGCESTLFAGVAPVAGVNLARVCEDARPVSLLAFHGTGDMVVPMEGLDGWDGDRFDDLRLFFRGDAWATVESWARRNDCAGEPLMIEQTPSTTRHEWNDCADGTSVVFVVTDGAGHVWPRPGIDDDGSVDASAEIRTRFLESP